MPPSAPPPLQIDKPRRWPCISTSRAVGIGAGPCSPARLLHPLLDKGYRSSAAEATSGMARARGIWVPSCKAQVSVALVLSSLGFGDAPTVGWWRWRWATRGHGWRRCATQGRAAQQRSMGLRLEVLRRPNQLTAVSKLPRFEVSRGCGKVLAPFHGGTSGRRQEGRRSSMAAGMIPATLKLQPGAVGSPASGRTI